jgi:hypothetical protein
MSMNIRPGRARRRLTAATFGGLLALVGTTMTASSAQATDDTGGVVYEVPGTNIV